MKAQHRAGWELTEKSSVSLDALRAELEGRQVELEASLKSAADARPRAWSALQQRTELEAQLVSCKGPEELMVEVERARLGAHERVRQEALSENADQVAELERRITEEEDKRQAAEVAWSAKQVALEEEFKAKADQLAAESATLREEMSSAQERTAAVVEELDQVRHLLTESNTRIEGLADELKTESAKLSVTRGELKDSLKALEAAEKASDEAKTESQNIAREYEAKAADLEATFRIDEGLRKELERSLTEMGQSLAKRENDLVEFKDTVARLNTD